MTTVSAAVKAAGQDPAQFTELANAKSVVFTLRFQGGALVIFVAWDGGPDSEGWHGTYTVSDDHTIVAKDDTSADVITYHFTLVGSKLTMPWFSENSTDPWELAHQVGIYGAAPFIRQPSAGTLPSGSPTTAASSPSSTSALPEGTYRTDPIPVAAVIATIKAAGQDPAQWPELGADKTVVFTIKFKASAMVQFIAENGGPDTVGSTWLYTLTDDHTLVANATDVVAVATFGFKLVGPSLALRFVSDTKTDAFELAHGVGIFNTAPFIRQP